VCSGVVCGGWFGITRAEIWVRLLAWWSSPSRAHITRTAHPHTTLPPHTLTPHTTHSHHTLPPHTTPTHTPPSHTLLTPHTHPTLHTHTTHSTLTHHTHTPHSHLKQAGVETGDILDELCGEPVLNTSHGKVGPDLYPGHGGR